MRNSILFVLAVASLESGCGAKLPSVKPFKMEVQQGNVVTSKMLLQLRPGMTRSQVRYIMGTPLIVDSFRDNRWDYFYELRKQGAVVEKRRVILDFDKDSLVSVRGDVIPSAENPDIKTIAEVPQKKLDADNDQAWTDKLKFWKSEDAAAKTSLTANEAVAGAKAAEAAKSVAPNESPAPAQLANKVDGKAEPAEAANAQPATEKEMAAQIADTVEPPAAFAQEAAAAPAAVAETEVVLPPAGSVAPAASKAIVAPAVAAAAAVATAKTASAKPVAPKSAKQNPVAAAKLAPAPVAASKPAEMAVVAEDEVIPYIPEGEYVAPVVPSEQDMVKGNMAEANAPTKEAEAHQVTEKGVAPKAGEATQAPPTFVAEQLPEPAPEIEPVLPPPVKATAAAAAASSVATMPDEASPVGDAEIKQAVSAWAQAWRSKDVKNYLAAYAADFTPEGGLHRKAWEAQRKQRLSAASGSITLVLNNLQISQDGALASVEFEQKYANKAYKDAANKTLNLRYDGSQKRWLITREQVTSAAAPTSVLATTTLLSATEAAASSTEANSSVADSSASAVDAAVQAWAQAWRSKNITAYLAAYAPEFVPEGASNRNAWESQRKKRLSPQQGKITLELANLHVVRAGETAVVTFMQTYASRVYRDETAKQLEMKLDAASQRWLIVREATVSGVDASSKQQVTAPEGSAEHLDAVLEQIGF